MRTAAKLLMALVILVATAHAGLIVTSPANGATVGTSVHFQASASSSYPISAIRVYVDNVSLYTAAATSIDTYLTLSPGTHNVVVQAWDTSGALLRQLETIHVQAGSGVIVSSPANGASVSSPVNIVASASSAFSITAMHIYVDNQNVFSIAASSLNASLAIAAGPHAVVVQAWDAAGNIFKAPFTINVRSSAPANATVFNRIEEMSGWQSCSSCAGIAGSGPSAVYSMAQNVATPALDGASSQFNLAGNIPYTNALWWKQLGANSAATHFIYDLNFYLANSQYAQALEFDVNQSVGGYKYIFGVQCDMRGSSGQWDVWDGVATQWLPTGVACPVMTANAWHHLTEEFQRDSSGNATFVAITLDGVRHPLSLTYHSIASSVNEINVAFQMDGDYAQQPYAVWLDEVSLTYW